MVDREVERGSGWSLIVQNGKLFAAMVRKPELLAKNIRTAFVVASGKLQSEVVKGFSATSTRAVSKPRAAAIGSRTGALAQSVKGTAEGRTLEDLRIVLRAGSRRAFYAPTQEYGTVGLTIPLPITMTARGVKRSGYDIVKDGNGYRTKSYGPTFIAGNSVMITNQRGRAIPIYALKKSVAIPPRLRMGVTIENNRDMIAKALGLAIDKTFRGQGAT
jgi:hypothetical protein